MTEITQAVAPPSYADHIRAYDRSVVLGGARTLFPVDPSLTNAFARNIRDTIKEAEAMAYQRGVDDARKAMRGALGL